MKCIYGVTTSKIILWNIVKTGVSTVFKMMVKLSPHPKCSRFKPTVYKQLRLLASNYWCLFYFLSHPCIAALNVSESYPNALLVLACMLRWQPWVGTSGPSGPSNVLTWELKKQNRQMLYLKCVLKQGQASGGGQWKGVM